MSSLVNTRDLAPLWPRMAFAMQGGCRFTAQLGSMRIAEEIDAMESIGDPAHPVSCDHPADRLGRWR